MKKNTPNKVDCLLVEEVVSAVKKAESKDDALQKCIDEVCTRLKWPIGHAYFPARDNPTRLEHSNIWLCDNPDRYKDFREITETSSFDIGVVRGRVLTTKKPAWIPDVTKDTNFPRAKGAQDIGVKAAFAFPVIADSEVIAVLEFFHPLAIERDEQILESVENIGKQVGKVMEVKKQKFDADVRKLVQVREVALSREIKPKINSEFHDSYTENMELIWHQVNKLNSNVYYLKRIQEFPFDLFELIIIRPFWTRVVDSMFESSIMIINKILIDNDGKGGKALTLKKLKNKIRCHFRNEEDKKQFEKDLKDYQFGKIDKELKKKVKTLRDKYYAHFDRDYNINVSNKNIKERTVFLPEIDELAETITSSFELLHFSRDTYPTRPFYFGNDSRSDIQTLLNTIAEKSEVMHMPEKNPELWRRHRKKFNDHEIETFNQYRTKSKLPQA